MTCMQLSSSSINNIKRLIISSYSSVASKSHGIHAEIARQLTQSPNPMETIETWKYPVLCHSGTPSDNYEPEFIYVNPAACDLFECKRNKFIGLQSKFSAEPQNREERAIMLKRAGEDEFISDYTGIRISSKGKRFRITNALVWTLRDDEANAIGQATVIPNWGFL